MGADSKDEPLAESGEHLQAVDSELALKAARLRDGLQASRFPERAPIASTTNAHWTAQYQGETAPVPRFETPPAIAATILNVTDPGTGTDPGLGEPERHDTIDENVRRMATLRIDRDPKPDIDTVRTARVLRNRIVALAVGVILVMILAAITRHLWAPEPLPVTIVPSGEPPSTLAPPAPSAVGVASVRATSTVTEPTAIVPTRPAQRASASPRPTSAPSTEPSRPDIERSY